MPDENVLFFTISGQRFTKRTALYKKLELLLPEVFPRQNFAFLGNPFETSLPYPLLWGQANARKHPTTKLLECWAPLNQFCVTKLRPALEDPDIDVIITDGLGVDALLYSVACQECEIANDEAFRLHSGLVGVRLAEQGIAAPEYFITRADISTVDAALQQIPGMSAVDTPARHAFIHYEETMLTEYFGGRVKHQQAPNNIDAAMSLDEMADQVINVITTRVNQRVSRLAAAAD